MVSSYLSKGPKIARDGWSHESTMVNGVTDSDWKLSGDPKSVHVHVYAEK